MKDVIIFQPPDHTRVLAPHQEAGRTAAALLRLAGVEISERAFDAYVEQASSALECFYGFGLARNLTTASLIALALYLKDTNMVDGLLQVHDALHSILENNRLSIGCGRVLEETLAILVKSSLRVTNGLTGGELPRLWGEQGVACQSDADVSAGVELLVKSIPNEFTPQAVEIFMDQFRQFPPDPAAEKMVRDVSIVAENFPGVALEILAQNFYYYIQHSGDERFSFALASNVANALADLTGRDLRTLFSQHALGLRAPTGAAPDNPVQAALAALNDLLENTNG